MSHHIKVHVLEGRATVDTLGTVPDEDCRVWVTGIDIGDIIIDEVRIEEPIQISVDVDGVETPVTGTVCGTHTFADVNPLLPNLPIIEDVSIPTTNTEFSLALPADTKRFMVLGSEEDYQIDMGFISGGNTIPIPCGANYTERDVNAGSVTLYFKANKAPRTVKVLSWSCV